MNETRELRNIVEDFVIAYEQSRVFGVIDGMEDIYKRSLRLINDLRLQEARDVDKMEYLKALVKLAREDYLERNSDGETDCVTPYDIY